MFVEPFGLIVVVYVEWNKICDFKLMIMTIDTFMQNDYTNVIIL